MNKQDTKDIEKKVTKLGEILEKQLKETLNKSRPACASVITLAFNVYAKVIPQINKVSKALDIKEGSIAPDAIFDEIITRTEALGSHAADKIKTHLPMAKSIHEVTKDITGSVEKIKHARANFTFPNP